MSVILKKERVQTAEVMCQKYSQTNIDCDVIVPDINPDILKILDVSGFITVKEKGIRSNKVYIQGTVTMCVLYTPDGDVMSKVKSLTAQQDFTHTVDIGPTEGDLQMSAEVEAEGFNYSLINSRKVSLRCTASISVKLTCLDEIEFATDVSSDDELCTESKALRLCKNTINSENRISICDQLEMPSGKPTIGEILKTTATPQSLEFTFVENKAIAKGQLRICNLYTSMDDGTVHFAEHTVPFSEILDVENAEEDMEGEIDYSISEMHCEAREDSDGEPRIFAVDIVLRAFVKGLQIQEPRIITDAYSLTGDVVMTSQDRTIEQLADNTTAQLTHRCMLSRPEYLPEISQVCDIVSDASVDRITAENGEITLYGHIKNYVIFITDDADVPIGTFTESSDFTHTFHVPDADDQTICEAKIFTEHVSYTISGESEIDLRVILGLNLRSFKNETVSQITDISMVETPCQKPLPFIVIYFVQKGDTLWSIAKRYKTTVEALKECNNLDSDMIGIGQEIRICR